LAGEKTFRCRVMTSAEEFLDVAATSAIFPAADGMVGVLPGRAPLMARLGAGRLTVHRPGRRYRLFVNGGLAQLKDDELTILARRCQPVGGK